MTNDPIARLAAANPVPTGAPFRPPPPSALRAPRVALALAVAVAVAIPAVAFAGRLGDLFGLSNGGTPVATATLDLSRDTNLSEAMQELGFPSTLQRLGSLNGVDFYAARRADGDYCFAIESAVAKGVGCDLNGTFPSAAQPVMAFPPLEQLAGYAADGVATVAGVDASGHTVVSAPVSNNLFAAATPGPFPTVVALQALDAQGHVLSTWRVPGR
jgi:hypothetical protein